MDVNKKNQTKQILKGRRIIHFVCSVLKIKVASYFQGTLIALSIWIVFPQRQ